MNTCLGLYIDNRIIKYAKVVQDQAKHVRVDSFGVKFISEDNLNIEIDKIIEETKSQSLPISINVYGEKYNYFNVISRLSKSNIENVLQIEFSELCATQNLNPDNFKWKYILSRQIDDLSMERSVLISVARETLANLETMFSNYKLTSMSPTSIDLVNLLPNNVKDYMIINFETNTQATVVANGQIMKVIDIPVGAGSIIDKVAASLNSYTSAYETCKGITIFSNGDEQNETPQEYQEIIETVFQDIFQRLDREMTEYRSYIKNIYVTGLGTIFNNIDLLIFEYFNIKTNILKPTFINPNLPNIDEITEANSAISLAMATIKNTNKNTNYYNPSSIFGINIAKPKKINKVDKNTNNKMENKNNISIEDALKNMDTSTNGPTDNIELKKEEKEQVQSIDYMPYRTQKTEFTEEPEYDNIDRWLLRSNIILGVGLLTYTAISMTTNVQISKQQTKIANTKTSIQQATQKYNEDITYVKNISDKYKQINDMVSTVINQVQGGKLATYNVAVFMQDLMSIIPKGVVIEQITTKDSKHFTINATSSSYSDLGYFISQLKIKGILKNAKTESVEHGSKIKIVVSGDWT